MTDIKVEYKDISLNAKTDLTATATDKQPFSNLSLLKNDNVEFKKYETFEQDFWRLDGTFDEFPDTPENENFALWSLSMSDDEGLFDTPPQLELNFSNFETAVGLTMLFSTMTGDYCNNLNIKWYQNNILLADEDFEPNDPVYFCKRKVERFNKILITFNSTYKPYRYLKVEDIQYGISRTFSGSDLRSATLLEDLSLTSEELRINTFDFTLNNSSKTDFSFQKKQPMLLKRNQQLLGAFYIESATRKSDTLYDLKTVDLIGVLDKIPFAGGSYNNQSVSTIIANILGNSVPYVLDNTIGAKTLTGTLKPCTKREALLEVLFATCAVADCSRSTTLNIKPLDATVKEYINNGVFEGEDFDIEDEVTEIAVTYYNGETKITRRNPIIPEDVYDNVLEFEGAFVNENNAEDILNNLYNYFITNKNNVTNMKFDVEQEYIESTGTQWIDTGIKMSNDIKLEMQGQVDSQYIDGVSNFPLVASNMAQNSNSFAVYITVAVSQQSKMRCTAGTTWGNLVDTTAKSEPRTIEYSNNKFIVDGQELTVTEQTYETQDTLKIFRSADENRNATCKLYYLKMWDGNTLVRDFKPTKDENGVVCLFDDVTKQYFYNQGTGSFSYGNNLAKVGDVIKHQTKWLGIKKGQIMQMKFNLNSNKLVAEAKVKDLE